MTPSTFKTPTSKRYSAWIYESEKKKIGHVKFEISPKDKSIYKPSKLLKVMSTKAVKRPPKSSSKMLNFESSPGKF